MGTGHGRGRLAFSVIPAQAGTQSPHDEDCVNTHWTSASAGETGRGRGGCKGARVRNDGKNSVIVCINTPKYSY